MGGGGKRKRKSQNGRRLVGQLPQQHSKHSEYEPKSWDETTTPFVIVRFFSEDIVTDDQITAALVEHSIESLADLHRKVLSVSNLFKVGATVPLSVALTAAIGRVQNSPERILGGILIYDEDCLADRHLSIYSPEAVSVNPPAVEQGCPPFFTTVLGSSGSGKTFFALKCLPGLVFGGVPAERLLGVHLRAIDALAQMERTEGLDFPGAVATVVQERIQRKLADKGWSDKIDSLDLNLHVTIDDAGGEPFKELLNKAVKIKAIVRAVKTMPTKILKEIHVTVVGTRLETTVSGVASMVGNLTFYLQPWTANNFDAFVNASTHPDKKMVMQIVQNCSALEALASNARCAYHLLDSMQKAWILHHNDLESFVGGIFSRVVQLYISSNGLENLKCSREKWSVARSIFKAVDMSTDCPTFSPTFDDLESERLRSVAATLVDFEPSASMHENLFSVSISPAIALVLAKFLNEGTNFGWNWQRLEFPVILGEWKWMMTHLQEIPKNMHRSIHVLQHSLPMRNDNDVHTFTIPATNKYSVLLNVPDTPYADVIAPFRLVKAHFSTGLDHCLKLDLENELGKLGLTNAPCWQLQQAVTSVLYTMWGCEGDTPLETDVSVQRSAAKQLRIGYYPFNTLVAHRISKQPREIVCHYDEKTNKVLTGKERKPVDVRKKFKKSMPVSAVFATNCRAFELQARDNTTILINRDDVDWQGRLEHDHDEVVRQWSSLKKNVLIRFLFC